MDRKLLCDIITIVFPTRGDIALVSCKPEVKNHTPVWFHTGVISYRCGTDIVYWNKWTQRPEKLLDLTQTKSNLYSVFQLWSSAIEVRQSMNVKVLILRFAKLFVPFCALIFPSSHVVMSVNPFPWNLCPPYVMWRFTDWITFYV